MKAHWSYLKYVLRHKWFVATEILRLRGIRGIGMALFHDWTKFLPREWFAYVPNFYNPDGTPIARRDATGAYDPTKQSSAFDGAWLSHQRNKHHWQAWVLLGDSGVTKPLLMPSRFVFEMIADWRGAGRAQGTPDVLVWWIVNGPKMHLHQSTRALIELMLGTPTLEGGA